MNSAMKSDIREMKEQLHEHGHNLADINKTLKVHNQRFDSIDKTLEIHNQRFNSIDKTLEIHNQRFDSIDKTLEIHNQRFEGITHRLDHLTNDFHEFRITQEHQQQQTSQILDIVQYISDQVVEQRQIMNRIDNHEHRIVALEHVVRSERHKSE